jgi:hypothetical protein
MNVTGVSACLGLNRAGAPGWGWRFVVIAALMPMLGGCLPGMKSGDSLPGAAFSSDEDDGPTVNRAYKQSAATSSLRTTLNDVTAQASITTDAGARILTAAISNVERRLSSSPALSAAASDEPALATPAAPQALKAFYTALGELAAGKRQTVTVLHLGDDHVADDRFAGDMREALQSRFGNGGRGLMAPGLFPVRGLKVDRGGDWAIESAAAVSGSYGITGIRATAKTANSWLRLTATQSPFDWVEVTFATGRGTGNAVVSVDGNARVIPTGASSSGQTSLRIGTRGREVLIKPADALPVTVLSVATGAESRGIRYVNLGLPGATALTPARWDLKLAEQDLEKLQPDLIVFGYGSREAFSDGFDPGTYRVKVEQVVAQIAAMAPRASLLVIGPPDASRLPAFSAAAGSQVCRALSVQEAAIYDRMLARNDDRIGRWHAPAALEQVRSSLRRAAALSGAYFWDWGKFMGGSCASHAWSTARPPLMAPDHVTFTPPGMERSARGLLTELMAGYEAFSNRPAAAPLVAAVATPEPEVPVKKKKKKTAAR